MIRQIIDENRRYLVLFTMPQYYTKKYPEFHMNLSNAVENSLLTNILFEEWIFLQEYSTIVAKSKKTFEKFKEAGAIAIEYSKKTLEIVIRRTLKKGKNDPLNKADKLRALGKWIGVGLSASTAFMVPAYAAVLVAGTGVFSLIDP